MKKSKRLVLKSTGLFCCMYMCRPPQKSGTSLQDSKFSCIFEGVPLRTTPRFDMPSLQYPKKIIT